jgi:hypothetical protein
MNVVVTGRKRGIILSNGPKPERDHELPSWHCYHAPTHHVHIDTIVMYDALVLSRIERSSPANEIRGSSDSIATVSTMPRRLSEGSCDSKIMRKNPGASHSNHSTSLAPRTPPRAIKLTPLDHPATLRCQQPFNV